MKGAIMKKTMLILVFIFTILMVTSTASTGKAGLGEDYEVWSIDQSNSPLCG
jgi:hypothetical protein